MLTNEAAGDAVVEEDAGVQIIVEVDGEGETALLDEGEPAGADIARGARARALAGAVGGRRAAASAAGFATLAGAGAAGLLAVLRAAARADARFGKDVVGVDLQDTRGECEDVEQARLSQVRRPILLEWEKVGGSQKIRSQRLRVCLMSRIQLMTSART